MIEIEAIAAGFDPARHLACTHPIGVANRRAGWRRRGQRLRDFIHGTGNGILTIARGTLPLAIFGPENYGYSGSAIMPARRSRMAQALPSAGRRPLDLALIGSRVLMVPRDHAFGAASAAVPVVWKLPPALP